MIHFQSDTSSFFQPVNNVKRAGKSSGLSKKPMNALIQSVAGRGLNSSRRLVQVFVCFSPGKKRTQSVGTKSELEKRERDGRDIVKRDGKRAGQALRIGKKAGLGCGEAMPALKASPSLLLECFASRPQLALGSSCTCNSFLSLNSPFAGGHANRARRAETHEFLSLINLPVNLKPYARKRSHR